MPHWLSSPSRLSGCLTINGMATCSSLHGRHMGQQLVDTSPPCMHCNDCSSSTKQLADAPCIWQMLKESSIPASDPGPAQQHLPDQDLDERWATVNAIPLAISSLDWSCKRDQKCPMGRTGADNRNCSSQRLHSNGTSCVGHHVAYQIQQAVTLSNLLVRTPTQSWRAPTPSACSRTASSFVCDGHHMGLPPVP